MRGNKKRERERRSYLKTTRKAWFFSHFFRIHHQTKFHFFPQIHSSTWLKLCYSTLPLSVFILCSQSYITILNVHNIQEHTVEHPTSEVPQSKFMFKAECRSNDSITWLLLLYIKLGKSSIKISFTRNFQTLICLCIILCWTHHSGVHKYSLNK